jgi:hypothetical protein
MNIIDPRTLLVSDVSESDAHSPCSRIASASFLDETKRVPSIARTVSDENVTSERHRQRIMAGSEDCAGALLCSVISSLSLDVSSLGYRPSRYWRKDSNALSNGR